MIQQEAEAYQRAGEVLLSQRILPTTGVRDGVLFVSKVFGEHPAWDHIETYKDLYSELRMLVGDGAVAHGDVTPWNVIYDATGIRVIDWEKARFDVPIDPIFNVLDFIFRGAAVASASRQAIRGAMSRLDSLSLLPSRELRQAVNDYGDYRLSTFGSSQRDYLATLSNNVEEVARRALK
ncbi:MAG: hypothetical protein F2735_00505 [Actinobacteria bacterium]|nr:hypothetical protein [Actinomycetota bacterium]